MLHVILHLVIKEFLTVLKHHSHSEELQEKSDVKNHTETTKKRSNNKGSSLSEMSNRLNKKLLEEYNNSQNSNNVINNEHIQHEMISDEKMKIVENIREEYKHIYVPTGVASKYKKFQIPLTENAIASTYRLMISVVDCQQVIEHIKSYEFISKKSYISKWLQNAQIICNYIELLLYVMIEKTIPEDLKIRVKNCIVYYVSYLLNETNSILGEITWANEIYIASKRSGEKDKFEILVEEFDKSLENMTKIQSLLIINIHNTVEECKKYID